MVGIQSASCSCEFNSSNRCICTVSGRAKIQYAGEYYVVLNWWSGNYVLSKQIYHKIVEAGESAYFDYSGTIDNTTAKATGFSVFLLKYGELDFMSEEKDVTPETCVEPPTEGILRVRAKDANTGVYLFNVEVSIDGTRYGYTIGAAYLIFAIDPGYQTITLTKDGYDNKVINTGYISAGATVDVVGSMDQEVSTGTVTAKAVLKDGTDEITGAKIYMCEFASSIWKVDTGYTTPHTFTLEPGTYELSTSKEHFTDLQMVTFTIASGDSKTVTCPMAPAGLQCDIDLLTGAGATIPTEFKPPTPGIPPAFGFKLPFSVGNFTYYGIGWAVLNEPAPHIVTSALVASMVVKVNDIEITPVITGDSVNGDIGFDLFTIIETLITNGSLAPDLTQLNIEVTYATRLWFETGNHSNNDVLYTETKTILIPITMPMTGLCEFIPSMTGPDEISAAIIPGMSPVVSNSILSLIITPTCENLTCPTSIPVALFLFGSDTSSPILPVPLTSTYNISSAIFSAITAAITAGIAPPSSLSATLRCPAEYTAESGFSTTNVETTLEIPIGIQVPELCTPSITALSIPTIPITPVDGVPAIGTVDPLTFTGSMLCPGGETPADGTSLFQAELHIAGDPALDGMGTGVMIPITVVQGTNTIDDIAMRLFALIITGNFGIATPSLACTLTYPDSITNGVASSDTKTITGTFTIQAEQPPDPGSLLCNIGASTTDPGTIPLNIPTPGATPVPGVSTIPITAAFTAVCSGDGTKPADLLTFIAADAYINDSFVCAITPDSNGSAVFDLMSATSWLSTIQPGATGMTLKIKFPNQLECSDPTPVGTKEYTRTIGLSVTGVPEPDDDLCEGVTCPDNICYGPNLYGYECVAGVCIPKLIEANCPDCPGYVPPDPECVLTAADFFTCPDGTVIQINECVNGVKVPIIPMPTCQGQEPECVITVDDIFTCPDGSTFYINKCVNGVKVPTGATCPEPPEPECAITPADYYTCPDGTVIQINECVNGVKVPTGATCPEPPEPEVDTRSKTVYVTAPMVTRVGKRISIVAFVRCGTEKSNGEDALITANAETITTARTRNGKLTASWIPIVAGLYNICVSVPVSGTCGTGASSSAYVRVVSELSPPEIAAAEKEFEKTKERIGEIMERI